MTREQLDYLVRFVIEGVYYLDEHPTKETKTFYEFRHRPDTLCFQCHVANVADEILSKIPDDPFGEKNEVAEDLPAELAVEEAERERIKKALEVCNGNRNHTANRLGISVRTLNRKMKEYDL